MGHAVAPDMLANMHNKLTTITKRKNVYSETDVLSITYTLWAICQSLLRPRQVSRIMIRSAMLPVE